jgi:hypothetical protein
MSSPRKINDHSAWMGARGKNSVLPDGPHKVKTEMSAEGAGHIASYDDTTEDIRRDQMAGDGKIKGRPMKPGYRY